MEHNDTNYIESILHYVIETPESISEVEFIEHTLHGVDFIIYFYIKELFKQHSRKLTLLNLQAALGSNKMHWIDPKSIFMKGKEVMTKAYITSLTSEALVTPTDYANVLEKATILRYKEIMETPLLSSEDFAVLRIQVKEACDYTFVRNLITDLCPLMEGKVPYLILNSKRYNVIDATSYIMDAITTYELKSQGNHIKNYKENMQAQLADSVEATTPVCALNLGKTIMTHPSYGHLLSIMADAKIGKTRFTLGEVVLPSLLLGLNVQYLSSEISRSEILAALLTKFIFLKGYRIPEKIVLNYLISVNAIRRKTASDWKVKFFKSLSPKIKSILLLAEEELFYSGKYGKITIREKDEDVGSRGVSKYFVYEEYFPLIRAEIKSMRPEDRYSVIVRDHVNHMVSSTGMTPTDMVTSYIQDAKTLAKDKTFPCLYVVINHFATEVSKEIKKQGSIDGIDVRGFNTNEDGKTSDLQLCLYERAGQRKDGLVTLFIKTDRRFDTESAFKTREFTLEANRGICDFRLNGETKPPYPVKEEFEQFLKDHALPVL